MDSYKLVVKAEDPQGLYTTANVFIDVLDVNDENPVFEKTSYTFSVSEGIENAFVGRVHATDADLGDNAAIEYSISDFVHFQINPQTGQIYTRHALDYEKQRVYYTVISAHDITPNARLATASLTVSLNTVLL